MIYQCVDMHRNLHKKHLFKPQKTVEHIFCSRCCGDFGPNPIYDPKLDTNNKENHIGVKEYAYVENTTPSFNLGLGCITHGTRHAEKIARSKGLQPIGDAPLKMEHNKKPMNIDSILREGVKAARVGRTLEGVPLHIAMKKGRHGNR